jgi:hypothetical protein
MNRKELIIGFCLGLLVGAAFCYATSRKYELIRVNEAVICRINTRTGETCKASMSELQWVKISELKD